MKPPPMPDDELRRIRTEARSNPEAEHTFWWLLAGRAIETARDAQWQALLADAVAQERERLAKRLDELGCDHCAAAIRAQMDNKTNQP